MTAEQLEASRAERLRHNGRGQLTLEDARTWIEETGLCLFLPRKQFSSYVAPSFVEAVAGERTPAPETKIVALAEDLLVRLELDGVAVRLNLQGQPGEQPDFVVAAWVLPYVYALRGDRDWRRSPQLTGSRQVSQLAIQAYKQLETGDATIPQLKHALGREVSESAVLRAITELWQQLRIIPVVAAPGKTAQWQLLRHRFQKAIAEGASTSQVTAISVLASIYLQAVIAASMEEVELFLSPLTARSKVREVLRGLVATRQVHTISLGHAPHFYVAGTLPEFAPPPTMYASSSMPASSLFLRSYDHNEDFRERLATTPAPVMTFTPTEPRRLVSTPPETASQIAAAPKLAAIENPLEVILPVDRQDPPIRDRKPAATAAASRPVHRGSNNGHSPSARNLGARTNGNARHESPARWPQGATKAGHGKANGTHSEKESSNGNRFRSSGPARTGRSISGASSLRKAKPATARSPRSAHGPSAKSATKPAARRTSPRKDVRAGSHNDARAGRGTRKPALTASAKAGNRARYGFTAAAKQRTKKRG